MDFYYMPPSGPCRSIMMLAKGMNLDLNLKFLNLFKKEQMKPDFLKINPMHTIPTLNDNGFVLWESRAILVYLVEKYGKNDDSWYPKDAKKRALINQRLYFDMGTLYQRFAEYFYPQIFEHKEAVPEKFVKFEEALSFLDLFLSQSTYAAGENITIADLALVASVATFDVSASVDLSKYENIVRWYNLCKSEIIGYHELNHEGALQYKVAFNSLKK